MSNSTSIPSHIYRNVPFTNITSPVPTQSYVVASMYNYYDDHILTSNEAPIESTVNKISLNKFNTTAGGKFIVDSCNNAQNIYLNDSMSDDPGSFKMVYFLNLFFSTGPYFNVSPNNANNAAIVFNSQTFASGNSPVNKFNLYNFLLDSYLENTGLTRNNISPRLLLHLRKETNKIKSLADIKGTTVSSSWDAVIADLSDTGIITPDTVSIPDESGNYPNPRIARVPLSIVLHFHSFVLDMDAKIEFTYEVGIEGYVLTNNPPAQPSYNNTKNN
jgi:hypothetical protein